MPMSTRSAVALQPASLPGHTAPALVCLAPVARSIRSHLPSLARRDRRAAATIRRHHSASAEASVGALLAAAADRRGAEHAVAREPLPHRARRRAPRRLAPTRTGASEDRQVLFSLTHPIFYLFIYFFSPHVSRPIFPMYRHSFSRDISRGADDEIEIRRVRSLLPALRRLKADGWHVVGLEQTNASVSMFTYRFPKNVVLVVGHER